MLDCRNLKQGWKIGRTNLVSTLDAFDDILRHDIALDDGSFGGIDDDAEFVYLLFNFLNRQFPA
jgi:hypothetical protein